MVNPGTPASDHARFWDQGFSAVLVGESFKLNTIKVFPNPVLSTLNIEHPFNEDLSFGLFTIEGKKIFEQVLTKKRSELNVSQFSPGPYFVRISEGERVFSQKIVIGK